jgi:hypothetical protein
MTICLAVNARRKRPYARNVFGGFWSLRLGLFSAAAGRDSRLKIYLSELGAVGATEFIVGLEAVAH